ncbi:MAG: LpqB family beta-propeller domain-containing protein [Actinomycetaceae bacterium]|nr:LpqB family beta-propeller domain-containing protein [Actinomycetaceae bacterium]
MRVTSLLVALATACVMTGCAQLPHSGDPQAFDPSAPNADPIDLEAGGPVAGATPEELVRDFLLACAAGPSDDYATARLFLTQDSAQEWDPLERATIYPTSSTPNIKAGDESDAGVDVSLTVPAIGSIDSAGVLTLAPSSQVESTLHLVRVNDQWRIRAPENGVLVSQSVFMNSHQRIDLQFLSTTGDALIADPRWFSRRRLATHIIEGLIAGPRPSLAPAIRTIIPPGTSLSPEGVEITEDTAKVQLEATTPIDPVDKQRLNWQIMRTLTGARVSTEVQVTLNEEQVNATSTPADPQLSLDAPAVLTDTGISALSGTVFSPIDGPASGAQNIHSMSVGPRNHAPLAWMEGGSLFISGQIGAPPRRIDGLQPNLQTSVDRFGWVWTAGENARVSAWHEDGRDSPPGLPQDAHTGIISLRISPDGSRALLLRATNGVTSAWMGTVSRRNDGSPIAIDGLERVGGLEGHIVDASWAGSTSLVLIHDPDGNNGGELSLVTFGIGEFLTEISAPPTSVAVTGGANPSTVLVRLKDGSIQSRSGSLWQPLTLPAPLREIRFPG